MLRRASMQDLSAPLAAAGRALGTRLREAGRRAWIVGGAPRDLCLGRSPGEIDVASAARPDEVEALFERTVDVGRPFGTVLVPVGGLHVQHTTFRSESGYSDARRPDLVRFGETVEGDSGRRDFTCNALYLDPLTDELLDPQGGLEDLRAQRLRCVGEAEERFREDGLRLLRLARFAASLGLEPEAATLAAAQRCADALRGVSMERVLEELRRILSTPRSARAVGLLAECGLLTRAIPGARAGAPALLRALPDPPGLGLGLAALLEGAPEGLAALRASRAERRAVEEIWRRAAEIEALPGAAGPRSRRVRILRASGAAEALALLRAGGRARGCLEALAREREELGPSGLWPEPLLQADDLDRAGIVKGPRWGEILEQAEALQLDGALAGREQALRWLGARAQEGGNTPRRP